MERLQEHFDRLQRNTTSTFHRYMYNAVKWDSRLIGIVGPRGVGKTTMLLQYAREQLERNETLYVTAEDLYFTTHHLVDLADELVRTGGRYLLIDEIHKYNEWSRELKLIYDYHPELHVIFTGSSVLDIVEGLSDLSRRARMYQMQGLSYREYLKLFHDIEMPVYTLEQIVEQQVQLPEGFLPLKYFANYLRNGYYPFAYSDSDISGYLRQIVNITLEVDIPQYASLTIATARKMKQLLGIIAESAPFKPNFTAIAGKIGVSRNNVADFCAYIERAGLIAQLRGATGGIQALGKVEKIYIDNPTLAYALGETNTEKGTIRETFFQNQMRLCHHIVASPVSDFLVDGRYTFEVGGKKKRQRQIHGLSEAYVVKDDIETGYGNIIPLWVFGLTY